MRELSHEDVPDCQPKDVGLVELPASRVWLSPLTEEELAEPGIIHVISPNRCVDMVFGGGKIQLLDDHKRAGLVNQISDIVVAG